MKSGTTSGAEDNILEGGDSMSDFSLSNSQTTIGDQRAALPKIDQDSSRKSLETELPSIHVANADSSGLASETRKLGDKNESMDTDLGGGEDEIETLLASHVSKDYINCVWSNAPLSLVDTKSESIPEKLIDTAPSPILDEQNGETIDGTQSIKSESVSKEKLKKPKSSKAKKRKTHKESSAETGEEVPPKKHQKKAKQKLKPKKEEQTCEPNEKKNSFQTIKEQKSPKTLVKVKSEEKNSAGDNLNAVGGIGSPKTKVICTSLSEPPNVSSTLIQSLASYFNEPQTKSRQLKVVRRLEPVDPWLFTMNAEPIKLPKPLDLVRLANPADSVKFIKAVDHVRSSNPGDQEKSSKSADQVQSSELADQVGLAKVLGEDVSLKSLGEVKSLNPILVNPLKLAKSGQFIPLGKFLNPTNDTFSTPKNYLAPTHPPYSPTDLDDRFFSGKFFNCKACGDKYVLRKSLLAHLARKVAKFVYKCSFCEELLTFTNRCSILLHALSHGEDLEDMKPEDVTALPLPGDESEIESLFKHTSLTYEECSDCKLSVASLKNHFEGKDTLAAKETTLKTQIDPSLVCNECEYILPSNCAFAAHKRYHSHNSPHTCPDCGELFLKSSALLSHMEEKCFHHLKRSMYQCGFCKSFLASKSLFQKHLMSDHLRIIYSCNICGLPASGLHGFNVHRNIMHELPDISEGSDVAAVLSSHIQCDKCPGVIINMECLEAHAVMHSLESKFIKRIFQCNKCGCILSSRELIRDHILALCPSNLPCLRSAIKDECGFKEMKTSVSVLSHEQHSVSSNEPDLKETPETVSAHPSAITQNSNLSRESRKCKALRKSFEKPVENSCENILKKSSDFDAIKKLVPTQHENHASKTVPSNVMMKNVMCKLCRKVVSEGIDKAAIKMHFTRHHFGIFMKAVYGKGSEPLPMKIVYRGSKESVHKSKTISFKKFSPPSKGKTVSESNGCVASDSKQKFSKKSTKRDSKSDGPDQMGTIIHKVQDLKNSCLKCYKCQFTCQDRVAFKKHIVKHKLNSSDLQCPECGLCFIVRPPLEKHLIALHFIENVDKYLEDHGFMEHISEEDEEVVINAEPDVEEDLQENQCKVCRKKFDSALLLEKHFRVHGGAFLLAKLKAKRASQ